MGRDERRPSNIYADPRNFLRYRPSPLWEVKGDRKTGKADPPAGYGLLPPANQRKRREVRFKEVT